MEHTSNTQKSSYLAFHGTFVEQDDLTPFRKRLMGVDPEVKIAASLKEVNKVEWVRNLYYRGIYPETYAEKPDPYYRQAIHCYLTDDNRRLHGNNKIIATMSFAFDDGQMLPCREYFEPQIAECKANNETYMVVGRMLVTKHGCRESLTAQLYKFIYYGGVAIGIKKVMTLCQQEMLEDFCSKGQVDIVSDDTGKTFGSNSTYAAVIWTLPNTYDKFFDWTVKVDQEETQQ